MMGTKYYTNTFMGLASGHKSFLRSSFELGQVFLRGAARLGSDIVFRVGS